jgi:glyoxylase-like metal-dependent hydrolase (beta-lactamase superfamily II)
LTGPREVSPGVYCLELPLPWEIKTVNTYLAPLADGYLLVDSGAGTEACFDALRDSLLSVGVRLDELRGIFLTHFHPDHTGLAARIQSISGAKIWMHPAEAENLRAMSDPAKWLEAKETELTIAGVPAGIQRQMGTVFSALRLSYPEVHPTEAVRGGEIVRSLIGPLTVVWTPGHSRGHVCLHQKERRLFFSGDHILPGITPNIPWVDGHDTLGDYLDSLRHIETLPIDLVLPAHGLPFSGHREWIGETVRHHRDRCREIRELLTGQAQTAHEIACLVWKRETDPLHHFFAAMEAMAHLEHMYRLGEVSFHLNAGARKWEIA